MLEKSFIVFTLVVEVARIYGSVIVLHGEEENVNDYVVRKLLCVADEDGSALVWNIRFDNPDYRSVLKSIDKYSMQDLGVRHLYNSNDTDISIPEHGVNCMLNNRDYCSTGWATRNWGFISSMVKPMGPVFDRRWEGFAEDIFPENIFTKDNLATHPNFFCNHTIDKAGSVVFSVRGNNGAHLALCATDNMASSYCYWITIGVTLNSMSVIRKCANGMQIPMDDLECLKHRETYYHQPMSAIEWRTFILSWNKIDQSIELHDREKRLLKYVDPEAEEFYANNYYYLHLGTYEPIAFRLHSYEFFQTSDVNAVLSSPSMLRKTPNVCLDMVVGLCTQCGIDIFLIDAKRPNWSIKVMTLNGSVVAQEHGLPMWQRVKIDKTPPDYFGNEVNIIFVPKLEKIVDDRVWAIADVEECVPKETIVVKPIIAVKHKFNIDHGPLLKYTCQKLSYTENHLVHANFPVALKSGNPNTADDHSYCPYGRTGLYCLLKCKSDLGLGEDCLKEIICDTNGCFCQPGRYGNYCERYCQKGKYGRNCTESCGNCVDGDCHSVTGECTRGCENSENHYLPPLCKTEIVLPQPKVNLVTKTSAQVSLPVRDEYKATPLSYTFKIESEEGSYQQQSLEITGDTEKLTGNFLLTPGTTYSVKALLIGNDSQQAPYTLYSPEVKFTALCDHSTTFEVTPHETSITLHNILQPHVTHPCPAKWYMILIEETSTHSVVQPKKKGDFPLKIARLMPSTSYIVYVNKSNITLFVAHTYTLARGPSQVENLGASMVSSTHIQLQWDPPMRPNGIITKYMVQFEAHRYLGCQDLRRTGPSETFITYSKNTMITLRNLHPYTEYIIDVLPYTNRSGEKTGLSITTDSQETPTAVLSGLRFDGHTFTWSDPVDCTTITGPIQGTKLTLTGVSENVRSLYVYQIILTGLFNLSIVEPSLYGAETYRTRVYALRKTTMKYNESAYIELTFTTPPKAPPPITSLQRFEMDPDAKTLSIRWKEPPPPTNGQIQYYTIIHCNKNLKKPSVIATIPFNQSCEVWKDYICATFEEPMEKFSYIGVRAHNKDVLEGGPYQYILEKLIKTTPTAPENITWKTLGGGVIELNWTHPWIPGSPLKMFVISIQLNVTKLKGADPPPWKLKFHEHIITRYQLHYVDRLYLRPSSSYKLDVSARSNLQGVPRAIEVFVPSSLAFESELRWKMYSRNATISLDIPRVLNDTVNSAMYVVVVGPRPCEDYLQVPTPLQQKIGIVHEQTAWVAGILETSEYSGGNFTVGDNRIYNDARNCPLRTGKAYSIIVAVKSENGSIADQVILARTTSIYLGEVFAGHVGLWLAPVAVFFLLFLGIIIYWRRRKRNARRKVPESIEMKRKCEL